MKKITSFLSISFLLLSLHGNTMANNDKEIYKQELSTDIVTEDKEVDSQPQDIAPSNLTRSKLEIFAAGLSGAVGILALISSYNMYQCVKADGDIEGSPWNDSEFCSKESGFCCKQNNPKWFNYFGLICKSMKGIGAVVECGKFFTPFLR